MKRFEVKQFSALPRAWFIKKGQSLNKKVALHLCLVLMYSHTDSVKGWLGELSAFFHDYLGKKPERKQLRPNGAFLPELTNGYGQVYASSLLGYIDTAKEKMKGSQFITDNAHVLSESINILLGSFDRKKAYELKECKRIINEWFLENHL